VVIKKPPYRLIRRLYQQSCENLSHRSDIMRCQLPFADSRIGVIGRKHRGDTVFLETGALAGYAARYFNIQKRIIYKACKEPSPPSKRVLPGAPKKTPDPEWTGSFVLMLILYQLIRIPRWREPRYPYPE